MERIAYPNTSLALSHWDSDRIDLTLCEFIGAIGAGYAFAWYDPFCLVDSAPAERPCDDMVVELTVQAGDLGKRLA